MPATPVTPVDNAGNIIGGGNFPTIVRPQVSPDGGSTFYAQQGNAAGQAANNSNLNAGVNIVGGVYDYLQAVAIGIAPSVSPKVLKANISANGTINSWTDQGGNTYTAVTSGKTLYIARLVASIVPSSQVNASAAVVAFGNPTNQPMQFAVSSYSPVVVPAEGLQSIASGLAPTAVVTGYINAGTLYLVLIGWEQ